MTHTVLFAKAAALFFAAGLICRLVYPQATFDLFYHDTYYVIGTWTYVLAAGALFSLFAGIAVLYPRLTGRRLGHVLGRIHFWASFVALVSALVCAHIFTVTSTPYGDGPWSHTLLTLALLSLALMILAQLLLVVNVLGSLFWGERVRA